MSVVRGFGLNGKSLYTNVCKPEEVWCNFIVDSTNGNGLGTRSLKSNGYIDAIFMHTTQTPGVVRGLTNPNPVAGYALVIFKSPFNYYLGGFNGQIVPTTSNTTASVTSGNVYMITVLGTTTAANWQAIGLPVGITPKVGQSFVATATTAITGTGKVGLPGVPLAPIVTVIGDPNTQITNSNIAQNAGAKLLVQFSSPIVTMNSYTPAGTNTNASPPVFTGTPAVLTGAVTYSVSSPADGTVVGMQFCFDASSVTIDGI